MEHKIPRKFNTEFRKKLLMKFEKTKNTKEELIQIYNIIVEDIGNNFSSNRNGIFINMNILSDKCIDKLMAYLEEKNNISNSQSETDKLNYKTYKFDEVEIMGEIGHKLSNQEKNILKRIKNKDIKL